MSSEKRRQVFLFVRKKMAEDGSCPTLNTVCAEIRGNRNSLSDYRHEAIKLLGQQDDSFEGSAIPAQLHEGFESIWVSAKEIALEHLEGERAKLAIQAKENEQLVSQVNKRNEDLENRIESLRQNIQLLERMRDEGKVREAESEEKIVKLSAELNKLKVERKGLQKDAEHWQEQSSKLDLAMAELASKHESKIKDLKTQHRQDIDEFTQRLNGTTEHYEQKAVGLINEVAKTQTEKVKIEARLTEQLKSVNAESKSLQAQLSKVQVERDKLSSELSRKEVIIAGLNSDCVNSDNRVSELKQEVSKLKDDNMDMRVKIDRLEATIFELKKSKPAERKRPAVAKSGSATR